MICLPLSRAPILKRGYAELLRFVYFASAWPKDEESEHRARAKGGARDGSAEAKIPLHYFSHNSLTNQERDRRFPSLFAVFGRKATQRDDVGLSQVRQFLRGVEASGQLSGSDFANSLFLNAKSQSPIPEQAPPRCVRIPHRKGGGGVRRGRGNNLMCR